MKDLSQTDHIGLEWITCIAVCKEITYRACDGFYPIILSACL